MSSAASFAMRPVSVIDGSSTTVLSDGELAVKQVPPDLRSALSDLRQRDNTTNFIYLLQDGAVIAGSVVLAGAVTGWEHWVAYLVAVVLIGSRQRALANLTHEASHRKLFASRHLNDTVARLVCAWPLATAFSGYTAEHARHHRYLWGERDPERAVYERLGLADPLPGAPKAVARRLARAYGVFLAGRIVGLAGRRREPWGELVARWIWCVVLLAGSGLLGGWRLPVFYWAVPYFVTGAVITFLAEAAEHGGLRTADAVQATRSWTASAPVRWLVGRHSDDLYHLAHHLFPAIPHYRLRQAHRLLMDWVPYRSGHHCAGFFSLGPRSVLRDMIARTT